MFRQFLSPQSLAIELVTEVITFDKFVHTAQPNVKLDGIISPLNQPLFPYIVPLTEITVSVSSAVDAQFHVFVVPLEENSLHVMNLP